MNKKQYAKNLETAVALAKKHNIPFKFEVWQTEEDRENGYGTTYMITDLCPTINSTDLSSIVTYAEKLLDVNNFACIEIIYGVNDQTLWHYDNESSSPEIYNDDLKEFEQLTIDLDSGKKSFEEEFEDHIVGYTSSGDAQYEFEFASKKDNSKKQTKSIN